MGGERERWRRIGRSGEKWTGKKTEGKRRGG